MYLVVPHKSVALCVRGGPRSHDRRCYHLKKPTRLIEAAKDGANGRIKPGERQKQMAKGGPKCHRASTWGEKEGGWEREKEV